MVVVIQPCLGQHFGLPRRQHAQRHAGFEAHRAHALHDLDNRGHVAVLGIAPGRAHAEALRSGILGPRRRLQHFAHVHQLGCCHAAVRLDRLRAIAAVFRTAAGLDRQQGAQLDLIGRMVRPVHFGCTEQQLGQRQVEQFGNLFTGPVAAHRGLLWSAPLAAPLPKAMDLCLEPSPNGAAIRPR